MATGRIRRTARRGVAAAVLGWLGVAAFAVLMAPSASAAPSATIEIRTVTPPAASIDKGGQVTFVNRVDSYDTGVDLGLVAVTARVDTDVAVTFFGEKRNLQPGQSTSWRFDAPATTGMITYTYRVTPTVSLPLGVTLQQVVDRTLASLPPLPAPTPYVVQTIAPALPNLPSTNLPQLPSVSLPLPGAAVEPPAPGPGPAPLPGGGPAPTDPGAGPQQQLPPTPGEGYAYDTGAAAPRMAPSDIVAAAAFDPSRYFVPGESLGRADGGGAGGGSGGVVGGYDGASVPVFGQLAGLDGAPLEEGDTVTEAASETAAAQTLPAAALAAVVALAAVTAALVRTHQASRATR